MEQFSLKNKTILITGASSGIGEATAILCAGAGARLILVGRNEKRLQQVQARLAGDNHLLLSLDLTEYKLVKERVARSLEDVKILHGLIHAAGVTSTYPFKMIKPEQMKTHFETNVFSAFHLTTLVLKKMRKEPASIVFISSVMATVGEKAKTLYSMTKGALLSGSKSLALELAGNGIRVNCISPGIVNTPMTANATYRKDEKLYSETISKYPLGFGEADDVANACVYLLSDASRWITGTDLRIDGGFTAS